MPWLNTPWFVGGGVEHPENLFRLMAYVAFGGKQGVVRPTDCQVKQLAVQGGGIRVTPGAVAILNAWGFDQAYAGLLPTEDIITVPPAGAGGQNYLVLAQVQDPFQPGSGVSPPTQAQLQTFQYIRTTLQPVTGQPTTLAEAGLPAQSALPLARIELPANASVVLDQHIIDLRKLYNPSVEPGVKKTIVPAAQRSIASTVTTYGVWPTDANTTVKIPEWATVLNARVLIGQVGFGAAGNNGGPGWTAKGDARFTITAGATTINAPASMFSFDSDAGIDRGMLMMGAEALDIRTIAGKSATIKIEARQQAGANTPIFVDGKSVVALDVDWAETPVAG